MRRGVAVGLWVALAVLAALWLVYWICSFVVVQLTVATPGVVTGVVDMLRTASETASGHGADLAQRHWQYPSHIA